MRDSLSPATRAGDKPSAGLDSTDRDRAPVLVGMTAAPEVVGDHAVVQAHEHHVAARLDAVRPWIPRDRDPWRRSAEVCAVTVVGLGEDRDRSAATAVGDDTEAAEVGVGAFDVN